MTESRETALSTDLRASRDLLFPGVQPPLSHFGATLLRHIVTTGLRYSAHQLAQPLPEKTPVTIVKLRPYLDRRKIEENFNGEAGSCLARALLDPAGTEAAPIPSAMKGTLAFHRTRLRFVRPPATPGRKIRVDGSAIEIWERFTATLSSLLPRLNDALLSEIIASLDRRRKRSAGATLPMCQSPFAARFLAGKTTRFDALGAPDLRSPSWLEAPIARDTLGSQGDTSSAVVHPLRGRFREWVRIALGHLDPVYRAYAESAAERGLLDRPSEAYFFPFGLGHSLTGERAPGWLAEAVSSNRSEFDTAWASPDPPPDRLITGAPTLTQLGRSLDWSRSPLEPLP